MNVDPRFPTFEVDGMKFCMTYQEDDFGLSIVVLMFDGENWISWGGPAEMRGTIAENINDATIMAHGSLYKFLEYCNVEAIKRAKLKAKLPLPDPNNRISRVMYAMKVLNKYDPATGALKYPPPPLP